MNQATEFRVFGSPGCGKTTYLVDQIMKAGAKHGYDRVFVASFTRTAAKEISSRALAKLDHNEPEPNFGTLHAHGYHTLGTQHKLAENCIKQWCEDVPAYKLTGGRNADVDEVQDYSPAATAADELYADMMMQRELLVPQERWRTATRAFAARWESWKAANGYIDYTDMLEIPLRDVGTAPGAPRVGILDEAQDASPLQMALFRKWGAQMEFIVLAGDDDQCIFEWAGARPEVMLDGEFTDKRILAQSYRVPRAVHQLATDTIRAVRRREDKEYKPRDAEGEVRRLNGVSLQTPELIVRDMRRYLDAGKTVMLLATCSYMLEPLVRMLRAEGIAFHNPYRVKSGAWNPLRTASGEAGSGTSSVERLLNFRDQVPLANAEYFDAKRMLSWYEIIKTTGNIPRGKRAELIDALTAYIDQRAPDIEVPAEFVTPGARGMVTVRGELSPGIHASDIFNFFEPDCQLLSYLARPDLERGAVRWLVENAVATKAKALEYPARVLDKSGADALREAPRVIIGTIHSVKGGEADAVYVAPDVSYAGYVAANATLDARDSMTRLKYVAYTRARESLILLDAGSKFTM